jgi:hypothetical protein
MKAPLIVKVSLCLLMLAPGGITYWLTCVPETYKVGTFYGAVCILVFAACGIYHRRKSSEKETNYLPGRPAPNKCA